MYRQYNQKYKSVKILIPETGLHEGLTFIVRPLFFTTYLMKFQYYAPFIHQNLHRLMNVTSGKAIYTPGQASFYGNFILFLLN
ncbi:MAG: hypothetical protein DRI88_06620 [Bacteroidetes bacterium]|nr:MAG: hypothetical protein DRI88_06620 [Bacteroidota bacterium]RLD69594.1 MAG: hypothetical protein DRI87_09450 [Bacteroidota bacterium]